MNNTCKCPSFQNLTGDAYKPREPNPEEKSSGIVFLSSFYAVVFLGFVIAGLLAALKEKKANRSLGITEKPIVPDWLKAQKGRTVFNGKKGVRFAGRDFERQYYKDKETEQQVEKPQRAIRWLQELIYAGTRGRVHSETCLASVPMENFKCGEAPNDFSPISGSASGSFLTYQMFGDNKIQVTYYVEDGKTYPAGYCVYIEDPYLEDHHYSEEVIEKLKEGLKYQVDLEIKREYESEVLQKIRDFRKRVLDSLTMQFCESTGKIVAVGLENGAVKHFEWDDCYEHFFCFPCKTCELEEDKNAPPPYELLSNKDQFTDN